MIKNKILLKSVLLYILVLNASVIILLISKGGWILTNFNIFFIGLFVVNIFILIHNGVLLLKKGISEKEFRLTILYNVIFTLLSGVNVRMLGFIFNNNLGFNISAFFIKNYGGQSFGINYDLFNLAMQFFFYDNVKYSGFSIQLNLIMLLISGYLMFTYRKSISGPDKNAENLT